MKRHKLTLLTISRQERTHSQQAGVSSNPDIIDAVERRILEDISLTGINIRSLAQAAVEAEVSSRRPDWCQPGFSWYNEDLLIPIDEKGTQVLLSMATEAHLIAYEAIQEKTIIRHQKSVDAFRLTMGWIRDNLPGHPNLGSLMKALGPENNQSESDHQSGTSVAHVHHLN